MVISFGVFFLKGAIGHDPHYIPAITVDPDEDMSNTIVYENRVYSETFIYQSDDIDKNKIIGAYLGFVTPSIDEYTRIEKNDIYLAATMFADIYRVIGYAEEFRLCTYNNGDNRIHFYENLNGISVESGNDIFIDRLFFDQLFTWDAADIHCYPKHDSKAPGSMINLTEADSTSLYNALCSSEHILYEDISQKVEAICTLSIRMADNTIVEVHFYTGNYIDYNGVYFIMDNPIYDKIISLYRQK